MCDKVQTALDVIKSQKRKTLTKDESLMLFEKVIEDNKKMGERMTKLEKAVDELKTDVADVKGDVKAIKTMLMEKKKTIWDRIPVLGNVPNLAWILLIIIVCVVGSLLGANLDFLKDSFHIGGQ